MPTRKEACCNQQLDNRAVYQHNTVVSHLIILKPPISANLLLLNLSAGLLAHLNPAVTATVLALTDVLL